MALCVPDAAHNLGGTRNKCFEGTQEAIITKIVEWINDCGNHLICWLSGPAGFGKLSIAQTIAEQCLDDGTLAASFFFLCNAGGHSKFTHFITTLAYQLTLSIPTTAPMTQSALQSDRLFLRQSLKDQFNKLIIAPVLTQ
jgi:hypothetical protein